MSLVSFSGTLSGVNVTGVFLQGLFPVLMLLVLLSGTNFGVNVSVFFSGTLSDVASSSPTQRTTHLTNPPFPTSTCECAQMKIQIQYLNL